MRRLPVPALAALLGLALACTGATGVSDDRTSGGQPVGIGGPGGSGSTTRDPLVSGSWWNVRYLADDRGQVHASETIWDLAANGFASRTFTAWNVTFGYTDTSYATGRWSTVSDTLVLALDWPVTWNTRLPYRVEQGIGVTWLHVGVTAFRRVR